MTVSVSRKPSLTLIGPDLPRVLSLGVALERLYEPTMIQSPYPLREAMRASAARPACMVVRITQYDSVVDVRDLAEAAPGTRILFLAQALPLRAPVARLIRDAGHAVLAESESAAAIESTMIALLVPEDGRR